MKPFHGFMENHPIPRDITGFQFKLIGKMTVRQFVYFATGAVIAAFVFFILPIPLIIRLPVAVISISIGAAFAFVPVGGRPMDTMVGNFFKALSAPTKYIYQKTGGDLSASNAAGAQVTVQDSNPVPTVQQAPLSSPLVPDEEPKNKTVGDSSGRAPDSAEFVRREARLERALAGGKDEAGPTPADLQTLLAQTQLQKEALEKEIENLKIQLNSQEQPVAIAIPPLVQAQPVQPPPPPPFVQPQTPAVSPPSPAPPPPRQAEGLPMPESPNQITGIVNDPRGNPLQNIIVEVKDEEGNPVRAFKTNGLGRFAAATSLVNGKYILVLEDSKGVNKFDSLQIEAVGSPIPPIQITSVDPREELRRQLFN